MKNFALYIIQMCIMVLNILFSLNLLTSTLGFRCLSLTQRNNFSLKAAYTKMNEVSSFDKIHVTRRSLVLCDLDDTLLDYGAVVENYWKSKIVDPDYMIWERMIRNVTPSLTDDGFHMFLERINEMESELHFVTHRNAVLEDITKKHLHLHGLSHIKTHHLTGSSKGKYSRETFNVEDRDVIMIDDSQHVHEDIIEHIPHVRRYLFKKRDKNSGV